VGTEVLVDFINGDPDRPVVIGQMYNAAAMSPWELPPRHNTSLTGFRSKEVGSNRANSLVLDDAKGKIQAQINSDEGDSGLRVGNITRIFDHLGRKEARGRGFELTTQLWGVVRAAMGMFLTTDPSSGPVKDADAMVQRLMSAQQQHADMATLAKQNQAQDDKVGQQDAAQAINAQNGAIRGGGASATGSSFPELTRPDLVVGSAAGIATAAAEGTHQASGTDHSITARRDVSLSAGRSLLVAVLNAISVFAQKSIKMIAAGRVDIRSNTDGMGLAAQQDVTVASVQGQIQASAKSRVLLESGGGFLEIKDGNVTVGGPGTFFVKTGTMQKMGPQSMNADLALPHGSLDLGRTADFSH
jgi:type VI secretion system secreted protein VgrG